MSQQASKTFELEVKRLSKIETIAGNNIYFVLERTRKVAFLIDMGATKSLLPSSVFEANFNVL